MQKTKSNLHTGPNVTVKVSGGAKIQSMNINFTNATNEISPEIQAHISSQEMLIGNHGDESPKFNKNRRQTTKLNTEHSQQSLVRRPSHTSEQLN